MQLSYEAVIFDLDGTLVDSLPSFHQAANAMLEGIGHKALHEDEIRCFIGNGQDVFIARCLVRAGANLTAEQLVSATSAFEKAYDVSQELAKLYPGVEALLQTLRDNDTRIGLCTNRPFDRAFSIVKAVGISQFFDTVAGFETTPLPKPEPSPILYCLGAVGVRESSALFVGDSDVDAIAAQRAGVDFAYHRKGFGELTGKRAKVQFDHFDELAALV